MILRLLTYCGIFSTWLGEWCIHLGTALQQYNVKMNPRLWARQYFSLRYLRGQGIEIGALHQPLKVYFGTKVRYVDRLPIAQLREQYADLAHLPLIDPDIVDNGEELTKIEPESLDFIIANHFIEHCENPIGTIDTHLSKLREGGILFLAVPVREHTFDIDRPLTTFDHLLQDHSVGAGNRRREHFEEWVRLVNKVEGDDEQRRHVDHLLETNYSIHYHVWNPPSFHNFLTKLHDDLQLPFSIAAVCQWRFNPHEMIWLLKKVGKSAESFTQARAA